MKHIDLMVVAIVAAIASPAFAQTYDQDQTRSQSTTSKQSRGTQKDLGTSREIAIAGLIYDQVRDIEEGSSVAGEDRASTARAMRGCRLMSTETPRAPILDSESQMRTYWYPDGPSAFRKPSNVTYPPMGFRAIATQPNQRQDDVSAFVGCWVLYGEVARSAAARIPDKVTAGLAHGAAALSADGTVFATDQGLHTIVAATVADAVADPAVWAASVARFQSLRSCQLATTWGVQMEGREPDFTCGPLAVHPVTGTAEWGGSPWVTATGVYGQTVTVRLASTATISAMTEQATSSQSSKRSGGTMKGAPSKNFGGN